ncbi:MAG TPA: protein kinase [Gemmatimonadales bacterium]|nr:protein kinase [Gemmatimonadales bacterium]
MSPRDLGQLRTALAGRYRIERELGRGGMAVVLLAEDLKHRRRVAIKVLRPELARSLGSARFLREIEIAAGLNHPHILPLHDSGEAAPPDADSPALLYFVMPFVEGESLRDRLSREKQLPLDDALRITRGVADALAYAHRLGVVHRDIKPENILLQAGHPVVSDFGIASAVRAAASGRLTDPGLAVGTPTYMSPEQSVGETVDPRSDLYSLACVLYEMLAGTPPYTGATAQAIQARKAIDTVPRLRTVRETVPEGVEVAVRTALAKAPADRYATVDEFSVALSRPAGVHAAARSVAVLPFLNLSPDPDNEYFADGITEDVTAQLSKIRSLKVISRTSVMMFKKRDQSLREIGARLSAATLLDGSVRRDGDRVRIVAQLIDAETDQHLWAETYDRRLTDIFAIQSDVALQIATALRAELSPDEKSRIRREPTRDLQAYQLYLQGRHWFVRHTADGLRQAIDYFGRAIARDPGFALAHADLAQAYLEVALASGVGLMHPREAYALAEASVARALTLDSTLGEAHCMLGFLKYVHHFDWAGAEAEFRRALELAPGSADAHDLYGRLLAAQGRHDEAIRLEARAQELDPLSHRTDLASALLRAGRFEEAVVAAQHAVELDPQYGRARATLGWAYLKTGRTEEGLAELEQGAALTQHDPMFLGQLGEAYGLTGRVEQARDVLRKLTEHAHQEYVTPYYRAYVHTGLGEFDLAIDCLEQSLAEGTGGLYGLKASFLFAPLRGHPRFTALLERLNLS